MELQEFAEALAAVDPGEAKLLGCQMTDEEKKGIMEKGFDVNKGLVSLDGFVENPDGYLEDLGEKYPNLAVVACQRQSGNYEIGEHVDPEMVVGIVDLERKTVEPNGDSIVPTTTHTL